MNNDPSAVRTASDRLDEQLVLPRTAPDAIHIHRGGRIEPWLVLSACRNEQPTRPESVSHVVTLEWSSTTRSEAERREFWALDCSDLGNVCGARVDVSEWRYLLDVLPVGRLQVVGGAA